MDFEIKNLLFIQIRKNKDYSVYLSKDLKEVFFFSKKPKSKDLLSLFHNEKLKPFNKYIFIYSLKYPHKYLYIVDSFISDGKKISKNMPDISFYDFKQEIFDYLTTKGNKEEFWRLFDLHLKMFGDLNKALKTTYDRLLRIHRLPKSRRRIKRKKGTQYELFGRKISKNAR